MSNSKLYQPPPPPPRPRDVARDPLVALSRAPTMVSPCVPAPQPVVEELTDLTDDEGLEEWAKGGTRIMAKPRSVREPQAATQMQTPAPVAPTLSMPPQPSYYPVSMSAPPPPSVKRSSAGLWIAAAGALVLVFGGIAAAAGVYVYHAREAAAAALAVPDVTTVTPTVTPTATATDTPTLTPTATATTAAPKTPATATLTITNTSSVKRSAPSTTTTATATSSPSASTASGSIRTFAAGAGKPVYVDGKQVGVGGGKIATVCGHHSVAVGTGHAKTVEIPCNGSTITVGTPDGT